MPAYYEAPGAGGREDPNAAPATPEFQTRVGPDGKPVIGADGKPVMDRLGQDGKPTGLSDREAYDIAKNGGKVKDAPAYGSGQAYSQGTGNLGVGQFYNENTGYDPTKFNATGPGGGYYRDRADAYGNRGAPQLDYGLADQSRGQQGNALGLMQIAAMGQQPSAAAIQQQQGLNQAMGMQMSAAASARGGGPAQALAQRNAMVGGGDMMQNSMSQAAALRAQEMAAARGDYMTGAGAMRGADESRAQFGGTLALNARSADDAARNAYANLGYNADVQQNQMNLEQQKLLSGAYMGAQTVNANTAANNALQRKAVTDGMADTLGQGAQLAGNGLAAAIDKPPPPMGQSPSQGTSGAGRPMFDYGSSMQVPPPRK